MKISNHIRNTFTQQIEEQDCGVACLLSLIRYYGGNNSLQNLRELSGTNVSGTTLLGLYHSALNVGFNAEGCEADTESLIHHGDPVILHVRYEDTLQHYVVCYGIFKHKNRVDFLIGDPAKGLMIMSRDELEKIWISRACLTLMPDKNFIKKEIIHKQKLKWVKELIKDDISILGIAATMGLAITILNMVMAIFSQSLIDEILPQKNFTKLYLGVFFVFIFLLLKEFLSAIRQLFLINQSKTFNNRIISRFYTSILHLPKSFFDTRKTGEYTARLNDTARIQKVIAQIAGNAIVDAFMVITAIGFLFIYSWEIALICISCLPVYFLMLKKFKTPIIEAQRNVMGTYALSESNYISTLLGIESIKIGNKQHLFSERNKQIYGRYQNQIVSLGKIQIRLGLIANIFGVIFLIGILIITAKMVFNEHLKIGELFAILGISSTLLPSVSNLAMISVPMNEAKVAFDRMFEFVSIKTEEESVGNVEISSFESLKIINLAFRFPGRSLLLENVSLNIRKGEIIALMGENGSGKSTISQILQKHYLGESGQILINESKQLKDISIYSWRKLISIVPQNIHIFNSTVIENIAFDDAVLNPQSVILFLKLHGFESFLDCLPQSYWTLVGEEGIRLSGGQKQIIAIARALYHNPQLLILDEATSAMDRLSEKNILKLLMQLKNKMGIIFITHRLHVLKSFCDTIYLLENGIISYSGSHDKLLKSNNLYSRYWLDLTNNEIT